MITWEEIAQQYHIKYYKQISKVVQPLVKYLGVLEVVYIKTYKDGRFVHLSPYTELTEYYISKKLYRKDPYFRHPDCYQTGLRWYENSGSRDFQENISEMNRLFNVHSPLMMVERGRDFSETFYFSGRTEESMRSLHLRYLPQLKSFATYYKKELGSILHQMEQEAFSLIDVLGESFFPAHQETSIDTQSIHAFLIALGKKAEVERASSLSTRERDCLRLLIHGNSTKDTANDLKLSPRTVEFYLENVKNKLNCNTKRELCLIGRDFENLGLL